MAKPPPTFASLEGLLDHGHRDGFDIRPTLLRVLTDLYLQKPTHPPDDERYYTELALRLINSTDVPARAAVAERLAPYPASPRAVILRLARDVIDVAGPILRHSPCLTAADLELIMVECGSAHAAIIAMRLRRPQPPSGRSAAPAGPGTATADAAGPQAAELRELFFSASSAERRHILLNLEYVGPASPRAMPERASEIVRRLETAALAHNVEAFAREVESRSASRAVWRGASWATSWASRSWWWPRPCGRRAPCSSASCCSSIRASGNRCSGCTSWRPAMTRSAREAALCLVAIWQASDPREQDLPRPQPVARRPVPEGGRPASPLAARRPLVNAIRARAAWSIADRSSSGDDPFQEMAPGAILDLENPGVGIEPDFAHDPLLDLGFRRRLLLEAAAKRAIGRVRLLEGGLRRRAEQLGGAVEAIELDEDRAGLLGAMPAHRRKGAFAVAAPQIGRHPDRGLEAHMTADGSRDRDRDRLEHVRAARAGNRAARIFALSHFRTENRLPTPAGVYHRAGLRPDPLAGAGIFLKML